MKAVFRWKIVYTYNFFSVNHQANCPIVFSFFVVDLDYSRNKFGSNPWTFFQIYPISSIVSPTSLVRSHRVSLIMVLWTHPTASCRCSILVTHDLDSSTSGDGLWTDFRSKTKDKKSQKVLEGEAFGRPLIKSHEETEIIQPLQHVSQRRNLGTYVQVETEYFEQRLQTGWFTFQNPDFV